MLRPTRLVRGMRCTFSYGGLVSSIGGKTQRSKCKKMKGSKASVGVRINSKISNGYIRSSS